VLYDCSIFSLLIRLDVCVFNDLRTVFTMSFVRFFIKSNDFLAFLHFFLPILPKFLTVCVLYGLLTQSLKPAEILLL
jgi:hypothetical protein